MSKRIEQKTERLTHANELIKIIAAHGRRFFFCDITGRTAHLMMDERGRIWLHDEYSGEFIYTHPTTWTNKWRGFSHGGTLRGLVEMMRDYIVRGEPIPAYYLGPERRNLTDGNIWGYTPEDMNIVRKKASALPIIDGGSA